MNKEEILNISHQITEDMLKHSNIKSISVISEATFQPKLIFSNNDGTSDYYTYDDEKLKHKMLNIISKYKAFKRKEKLERIVND